MFISFLVYICYLLCNYYVISLLRWYVITMQISEIFSY
nr:MAG TPA: hypothetical protein [Caudoviricetes sp.]